MTIRMTLTPTPMRIVIIGLLMAAESILGGLLIILQEGTLPNEIQMVTLIVVALMTIITFYMAFLKTGEVPTE